MRRSSLLGVSLAAALFAAGCGGAQNHAGQQGPVRYASNGTFTWAVTDDVGSFDPYRSQTNYSYATLAYDTLIYQRLDGTFVSGLAQKWSADARSASFTLRSGVTCSDGTPLTASQVAADLNFLGNPNNGSRLYGVTVPSVPFTVTADDASRTVHVRMTNEPFGFLLQTVGAATPIVCGAGLKSSDPLQRGSDGTGPFVLSNVVPGQTYTFTVRKGYDWGPDGASTSAPGTPAKVVLRVVTNETTAANLLLAGDVNMAGIPGEDRQRLAARGLSKFDWSQSGAWLWFNHLGGKPTTDKLVRQALIGDLDTAQLAKVNTGGSGRPAHGLVANEPNPCPGDKVSGQLPRYDVAAAGALLDQAGWRKGTGGVRAKDGRPLAIDLHYLPTDSSFNKPTAELVAHQWEALGATVKLTGDTLDAMSQAMFQTSDWDVYMAGFGSPIPSALVPYLSGPVPPNGNNFAGLHNDDYDTFAQQAAQLAAPQSCTYWNKAEQALYRDVDVVPVADRPQPFFLNNAQARSGGIVPASPTSLKVLG